MTHNAQGFDVKHIFKTLASRRKFDEFCEIALGFSDTLPAFKEQYAGRKSSTQQNSATGLLNDCIISR